MSALLKQKAKAGVATKKQEVYGIADVFMRRRNPDGSSQNIPRQPRGPSEQREGERVRKIVKPKIIQEYPKEKMDKHE